MRLQQPVRVVAWAPAELGRGSCCPAAPGDSAELPQLGEGRNGTRGVPPSPQCSPEGQDPQSRGADSGGPQEQGTYVPAMLRSITMGGGARSIPSASPSRCPPLPKGGRPRSGKAPTLSRVPAAGHILSLFFVFCFFFFRCSAVLLPLRRPGGCGGRCGRRPREHPCNPCLTGAFPRPPFGPPGSAAAAREPLAQPQSPGAAAAAPRLPQPRAGSAGGLRAPASMLGVPKARLDRDWSSLG